MKHMPNHYPLVVLQSIWTIITRSYYYQMMIWWQMRMMAEGLWTMDDAPDSPHSFGQRLELGLEKTKSTLQTSI